MCTDCLVTGCKYAICIRYEFIPKVYNYFWCNFMEDFLRCLLCACRISKRGFKRDLSNFHARLPALARIRFEFFRAATVFWIYASCEGSPTLPQIRAAVDLSAHRGGVVGREEGPPHR